ncbi:hypothetical protein IE077_003351 [Cardiosporidium cionae]|uniref:Serpin domain-containing protein n=1 Tax=Cardiosporidium cionae TaxID=476202 RepID=A0ABQ7J8E2_9APIC|nr:hypothetical protein IE077_003351 [Cardiosporidium cionae]|eukprot:KAF8820269.1 hypothetical protein IE077_003351 [Cardiosporidium cionae]
MGNSCMVHSSAIFYERATSLLLQGNDGGGKNVVICPLCAAYMDAVYAEGAEGNSLREYEYYCFNVCHKNQIFEELNPRDFGMHTGELSFRTIASDDGTRLDLLSIVVLDQSWEGDANVHVYANLLKSKYGTTVKYLDIDQDSHEIREEMNTWVFQQTRRTQRNILPRVNPDSEMIAISTLYFRSSWIVPFREIPNSLCFFHSLQYGMMMKQDATFMQVSTLHPSYDVFRYIAPYGVIKGARIPFKKDGTSMLIFMPEDAHLFTTFLKWRNQMDKHRAQTI